MRHLDKGDRDKAISKFEKSKEHRIYGTGAEFMLARMGLEDDPSLDREGYREIVELLRQLGVE